MGLRMIRITQEVTYNTYPVGEGLPAAGTFTDLFLPVGEQTIREDPKFWTIRDAGVGNRLVRKNVGRVALGGSLTTPLFPSQALLLTNLAAEFVGSSPCLEIPSFTFDEVIFLDDTCTAIYRRVTGCKIAKLDISADQSDEGCKTMCKLDIIGSTPRTITGTDFPTPDLSAYPADDPFLFYQLAGNVTLNGSARTNFRKFNLSINNMLKAFVDENIYIAFLGWKGRDVMFSTELKFKSAADRTAFNAGTKGAASFEFNNGTHSVTFDLQSKGVFDSVADSLPIDDYFTQTISGQSLMDSGTGTDLTITVA